MKTSCLLVLCLAALVQPIPGDTIYQTNSEGNETVLQRDAIVIQQDSSAIVYKHFDLKERRVTSVRLYRSSLPMRVQIGTAAERAGILDVWKKFGYKATVTDQAGKITRICDLYLDFYPPGGRGSLLESVPALTDFPIQIENGLADQFEFDKIDHVAIAGKQLSLTLREGKTVSGTFIMPTTRPAEVRVMGITDRYDPASEKVFDFSVPLFQLKLITFE